jgi:integrase
LGFLSREELPALLDAPDRTTWSGRCDAVLFAVLYNTRGRVDITVIALWLGHEDPATTHRYLEADLAMKDAALQRLEAPSMSPVRFKARECYPCLRNELSPM